MVRNLVSANILVAIAISLCILLNESVSLFFLFTNSAKEKVIF